MAEPLKDNFDRPTVELLAERFAAVDPDFATGRFTDDVMADLLDLELKARVNLVADGLHRELPDHYPTALSMVVGVAETDPGQWAAWPLCSFVERHGLDWPVESLDAMAALTRRWSCEFAVRPFLEHHLEATLPYLDRWTADRDESVRRLASEGTRPLLPWARKVQALLDDPRIGLRPLEALR
ncbi:MAG: DNA alkylation repair protein, partial [Acidimicrobiales bacterium]